MVSKLLSVIFLVVLISNVCSINNEFLKESYDKSKLIQDASNRNESNISVRKLVDKYSKHLLKEFRTFEAENFFPFVINILNNNNGSDKCIVDLKYVYENAQSDWSLKMFDSFGKPEKGILLGNVQWPGEFEECISVYAPTNETAGGFRGQYCIIQLTAHFSGQILPIAIGSCLPDSCDPSKDQLKASLNLMNEKVFTNTSIISDVKLSCNPTYKAFTTAGICVILLFSIFIVLALVGSSLTVYEHILDKIDQRSAPASEFDQKMTPTNQGDDNNKQNVDDELTDHVQTRKLKRSPDWIEKCKPFFNCFCILTNGAKLLDVSSSEGQLPCLHGIRFLSLSWVIVCHTYLFGAGYARSLLEVFPKLDSWLFQIIINGFYSVDSFFLLSGFLLAYLFFESASKTNGKVPWLYIYVHRYIRLTPVYMIVLAFHATIYPYIADGPLWPTYKIDPLCHKNWWRNILYINNFFHSTEMCMGWSWYLSNDMQFFVISPIFLIALWKNPRIGFAILALFLSISTAVIFGISYHYQLIAGLSSIFESPSPLTFLQGVWLDYFNMLYLKSYARISPYLIGIALAYYLYKRKQNNSGKDSLVFLCCGWLITSTITVACLFGLYHRKMSVLEMSFYNAFNRTCFATGVAWVMYVCITDQGGIINSILSFKPFIPLSRISYCAYLVHPIVQYMYFSMIRSLMDFSHITMVVLFFGFLIVSYAAALITSLLFESPIVRLDKFVRTKFVAK